MSTADGTTGLSNAIEGGDRHVLALNSIGDMTLVGDLVLDLTYRNCLRLDPGGAGRNVDLPDEVNNGAWFEVINTADAAEVLTVRKSVADGGATVVLLPQNEKATVRCDGLTWYHTGIVTIQQS